MRPEGGVAESALGTVRMGLDKDLDVLCGLDNGSEGDESFLFCFFK